jgi:class 3 adenylate cyclase/tetratricopeptide (TPR) repeat protein
MTTENVALLFTDVVDSTALSQRLSPEAADEVRRDHFALLRRSLAYAGGTEVKNLGDGLMAVFGSASAALTCAVAMQQAVDRDNRAHDHNLALRVGLSGGEVMHEDLDYFGDPVVEAARLCATCDPGQILAADVVPLMAGRRSRLELREMGDLTLKGLREPLRTVEVLWEPVGTATPNKTVSLPRPLSTHPRRRVTVVGRETELSMLGDAAKRVFAGGGQEVVLVSGEAGQGKTTLVGEAARLCFDSGACVLFGHCEEDLAAPYQLFAEAFGHLVDEADEERLRDLVDTHGSEWARLVPALTNKVPDLPHSRATDPDSERYLLFAAAVGVLATVSRDDPVVLVLDDIQWADDGSLALLRHLAAADLAMRVFVLATFRDSELPQSPGLRETLGMLRRHPGVSRLELTGLDGSGVQSLMESLAGHPLDALDLGLADLIYRETDGNPFFVTEVLRHLRDTGAILKTTTGRWVRAGTIDRDALPQSVREVIGARVVRLGPDAERVLSTAAVIGRDFDLDLLQRACRLEPEPLLDILDAAAVSALVQEVDGAPGRHSFTHALVQHMLYEDLGPNRRARTHERVARALEDYWNDRPGVRVGELAHHWINATPPGNLWKAIRYSREAGDSALRSLAPHDALRHYAKALELCAEAGDHDPVLRLDLEIGLGTAQRQTGDPEFRTALLEAASQAAAMGDVDRLVAACLANDRGFYSAVGSTDREKIEALETALQMLPASHPDRALVLATLCSELTHGSTLERRQALADEAIAIAEMSGDDAVVVRVLNHVYIPLQVPSMLEVTQARATEALTRAKRIGDPVMLYWAALWRAECAARAGDLEETDRCIAIHGAMAEQIDQPVFTWGHRFVQSLRAQIAGDTDLAEQYATEALEIGTEGGQPDAALIFGGQFNIVSGQRGTQSELVPLIEKMAEDTPDIPHSFFLALLAKAHTEGDRTERAAELLHELAATGFALPPDQLWLTGIVDAAEAVIECRMPELAPPLMELLEPWSAQLPVTGASALGPVSHYLGGLSAVLGQFDRADAYFVRAAELSARIGAKFFAARTDLLWARMLVARGGPGDADKARDLLTRAREVAIANGYAVVERRAGRALHDLG